LKVSLEQVQANFRKFDLLDDQVKFVKGWFSNTLPGADIDKIAVLRLDGDLYSSTMSALDALYHRVSDGGYVIADDYFAWESSRRAVHDFLAKHHIDANIQRIDWAGAYWQVQRSGDA
jgi:O-methyltransferase